MIPETPPPFCDKITRTQRLRPCSSAARRGCFAFLPPPPPRRSIRRPAAKNSRPLSLVPGSSLSAPHSARSPAEQVRAGSEEIPARAQFPAKPEIFRTLCGGRFRRHVQRQLQGRHIIAEVLFLQAFEPLILPGCYPGPSAGNLIGLDRVFDAQPDTADVPLVGQLFSDLYRLETLVDPLAGITFR